ncbi:MAG: DUF3309 domain-containing protein [Enhydrobacter sp.]|nr:MAG: DUF3309 domain-containing protein [Enhydrobacter sp.]
MAVILASTAIAAYPCWRHSAQWGHGPSVAAALLMVAVTVAAVGDRARTGDRISGNPSIRIGADEVRYAALRAGSPQVSPP